jgi:hypothetical protein
MALNSMTSSFSFTNTSAMTGVTVAPTDLKPVTNYAKVEDEATVVTLTNKTAAISQGELLTYGCQPVKQVATKQKSTNPGKVSEGVQYQIRLDELLRTENTDGSIVYDEPIVAYLVVRHPLSSNITASHIGTVVTRLVGAAMREDGTFRFDDLMRSGLAPSAD